jgi:hypothetical protein
MRCTVSVHLIGDDAGGPLDLDEALRSSPRWPTGDRIPA